MHPIIIILCASTIKVAHRIEFTLCIRLLVVYPRSSPIRNLIYDQNTSIIESILCHEHRSMRMVKQWHNDLYTGNLYCNIPNINTSK